MRFLLFPLLLVVTLCIAGRSLAAPPTQAPAAGASAQPFSARDMAMLDRISAPRVSPDGVYLAYVRRRTDWNGNRGLYSLEVIDLRKPFAPPTQLLKDEPGNPDPAWSVDGKRLNAMSGRSGSLQLWALMPDGAGARQLTALPGGITGYRFGPDGALYVSLDAYPDCATVQCSRQRDEASAGKIGHGLSYASGPVRYGSAYEDAKVLGIFRVDMASAGAATEARNVSTGFTADLSLDGDSFAIGADGRQLFFVSRDPAIPRGEERSRHLYAVPADGSTPPRLVPTAPDMWVASPAVSPDGRQLAYLAKTGSVWTFGRTTIMLLDLATGSSRELTPVQDLLFQRLTWSRDGRALFATAEEMGQGPIYRIPVSGAPPERLTDEGTISDFDIAGNTLAYLQENLRSPPQLLVRKGGGPARAVLQTAEHLPLPGTMGEVEGFSFAGWDGDVVHGYVVKPRRFVLGRRYPAVLLIHGGPQQSFGNAWSFRWNPQVWAGQGYAVVMIDFHGSTGYGSAFGRAAVGHWGDRPLEDLQKGWSYVLGRFPFLDGDRACALGGSYGGYMVNWIAGRWNAPWKCLVDHAGIYDIRFLKRSMGISAFVDEQLASPSRAELESQNPADFSGKWRVPILITHGAIDYLVPIDQGISTYNIARLQGIPTQMLIFPDEAHTIVKPQNSVEWFQAVSTWLTKWNPPNADN